MNPQNNFLKTLQSRIGSRGYGIELADNEDRTNPRYRVFDPTVVNDKESGTGGAQFSMVVSEGPSGVPILEGAAGENSWGIAIVNELRGMSNNDPQGTLHDQWDMLGELLDIGLETTRREQDPRAGRKAARGWVTDKYGKSKGDTLQSLNVSPDWRTKMTPQAQARYGSATYVDKDHISQTDALNIYHHHGRVGRDSGSLFYDPGDLNTHFSQTDQGIVTGSSASQFVKRMQLSQDSDRANIYRNGQQTDSIRVARFLLGHGGLLGDGEIRLSDAITFAASGTKAISLNDKVDLKTVQVAEGTQRAGAGETLQVASYGSHGSHSVPFSTRGFQDTQISNARLNLTGTNPSVDFDYVRTGPSKVNGPADKALGTRVPEIAMRQMFQAEALHGRNVDAIAGRPKDTLALARSVFEADPILSNRYGVTDAVAQHTIEGDRALHRAWEQALKDAWDNRNNPEADFRIEMSRYRFMTSKEMAQDLAEQEGFKVWEQQTGDAPDGSGQLPVIGRKENASWVVETPQLPVLFHNYRPDARIEVPWRNPGVDAYAMTVLEHQNPELYGRILDNTGVPHEMMRVYRAAGLNAGVAGMRPYGPDRSRTVTMSSEEASGIQERMIQQAREQIARANPDMELDAVGESAARAHISEMTPADYLRSFGEASKWGNKTLTHNGLTLPSVRDMARLSSETHGGWENTELTKYGADMLRSSMAEATMLGGDQTDRFHAGRSLDTSVQLAAEALHEMAGSTTNQRKLSKLGSRRAVGTQYVMEGRASDGYAIIPDKMIETFLPDDMSVGEFRKQVQSGDTTALMLNAGRYPRITSDQMQTVLRGVDESTARKWGWVDEARLDNIAISQRTISRFIGDVDSDSMFALALNDPREDRASREAFYNKNLPLEIDQWTEGQHGQHQDFLDESIGKGVRGPGGNISRGIEQILGAYTGWSEKPFDELARATSSARTSKGLVGVATNITQRGEYLRVREKFGQEAAAEWATAASERIQNSVDMAGLSRGARDGMSIRSFASLRGEAYNTAAGRKILWADNFAEPSLRKNRDGRGGSSYGPNFRSTGTFFTETEGLRELGISLLDAAFGESEIDRKHMHWALASDKKEADLLKGYFERGEDGKARDHLRRKLNSAEGQENFFSSAYMAERAAPVFRRELIKQQNNDPKGQPFILPDWAVAMGEQQGDMEAFKNFVGRSGFTRINNAGDKEADLPAYFKSLRLSTTGDFADQLASMIGYNIHHDEMDPDEPERKPLVGTPESRAIASGDELHPKRRAQLEAQLEAQAGKDEPPTHPEPPVGDPDAPAAPAWMNDAPPPVDDGGPVVDGGGPTEPGRGQRAYTSTPESKGERTSGGWVNLGGSDPNPDDPFDGKSGQVDLAKLEEALESGRSKAGVISVRRDDDGNLYGALTTGKQYSVGGTSSANSIPGLEGKYLWYASDAPGATVAEEAFAIQRLFGMKELYQASDGTYVTPDMVGSGSGGGGGGDDPPPYDWGPPADDDDESRKRAQGKKEWERTSQEQREASKIQSLLHGGAILPDGQAVPAGRAAIVRITPEGTLHSSLLPVDLKEFVQDYDSFLNEYPDEYDAAQRRADAYGRALGQRESALDTYELAQEAMMDSPNKENEKRLKEARKAYESQSRITRDARSLARNGLTSMDAMNKRLQEFFSTGRQIREGGLQVRGSSNTTANAEARKLALEVSTVMQRHHELYQNKPDVQRLLNTQRRETDEKLEPRYLELNQRATLLKENEPTLPDAMADFSTDPKAFAEEVLDHYEDRRNKYTIAADNLPGKLDDFETALGLYEEAKKAYSANDNEANREALHTARSEMESTRNSARQEHNLAKKGLTQLDRIESATASFFEESRSIIEQASERTDFSKKEKERVRLAQESLARYGHIEERLTEDRQRTKTSRTTVGDHSIRYMELDEQYKGLPREGKGLDRVDSRDLGTGAMTESINSYRDLLANYDSSYESASERVSAAAGAVSQYQQATGELAAAQMAYQMDPSPANYESYSQARASAQDAKRTASLASSAATGALRQQRTMTQRVSQFFEESRQIQEGIAGLSSPTMDQQVMASELAQMQGDFGGMEGMAEQRQQELASAERRHTELQAERKQTDLDHHIARSGTDAPGKELRMKGSAEVSRRIAEGRGDLLYDLDNLVSQYAEGSREYEAVAVERRGDISRMHTEQRALNAEFADVVSSEGIDSPRAAELNTRLDSTAKKLEDALRPLLDRSEELDRLGKSIREVTKDFQKASEHLENFANPERRANERARANGVISEIAPMSALLGFDSLPEDDQRSLSRARSTIQALDNTEEAATRMWANREGFDNVVESLLGHKEYQDQVRRPAEHLVRDANAEARQSRQWHQSHKENAGWKRQQQMYSLMALQYAPMQVQMVGQWEFGANISAMEYQQMKKDGGYANATAGGSGAYLHSLGQREIAIKNARMEVGRGREDGLGQMVGAMPDGMAYAWGKYGAPIGQIAGYGLNAVMLDAMAMDNKLGLADRVGNAASALGGFGSALIGHGGGKNATAATARAAQISAWRTAAMRGGLGLAVGVAGQVGSDAINNESSFFNNESTPMREGESFSYLSFDPLRSLAAFQAVTKGRVASGLGNTFNSDFLRERGEAYSEVARQNYYNIGMDTEQMGGWGAPNKRPAYMVSEDSMNVYGRVGALARNDAMAPRWGAVFQQVEHALGLPAGEIAQIAPATGQATPYFPESSGMAQEQQEQALQRAYGKLEWEHGRVTPASALDYQQSLERSAERNTFVNNMIEPYAQHRDRSDIYKRLGTFYQVNRGHMAAADMPRAIERHGAQYGIPASTPWGVSIRAVDSGQPDQAIIDPVTGRPFLQDNKAYISPQRAQELGLDKLGFTGGMVGDTTGADIAYQQGMFQQRREQAASSYSFGMRGLDISRRQLELSHRSQGIQNAHQAHMLELQGRGMEESHAWQWNQFDYKVEGFQMGEQFKREVARPYQHDMFNMNRDFARGQAGFQLETMQMQLSFWEKQRGIQGEMRSISRDSNDWMKQSQRDESLMRRDWQREDMEQAVVSNAREFGWRMEDYDEAIRFSSGRDRKKLTKEKERDVIRYDEQQRDSDEKIDRFEKLAELEDERYNRAEEGATRMRELEDQLWEIQGDHQKTMMLRQMEAHKARMGYQEEMWTKQEDYFKAREKYEDDMAERQEEQFEDEREHIETTQALDRERYDAQLSHHATMMGLQEEQHELQVERLQLQEEQLGTNYQLQMEAIAKEEAHWLNSIASQLVMKDNMDEMDRSMNDPASGALPVAIDAVLTFKQHVQSVLTMLQMWRPPSGTTGNAVGGTSTGGDPYFDEPDPPPGTYDDPDTISGSDIGEDDIVQSVTGIASVLTPDREQVLSASGRGSSVDNSQIIRQLEQNNRDLLAALQGISVIFNEREVGKMVIDAANSQIYKQRGI